LLLIALLAACSLAGREAGAQGETLTVYAAASLTDAFNALGPRFEQAHPGWKARFSYGASSTLRAQIEQGAPADVFASADSEQMQPLVSAGLVLPPQFFARNRLALVVPAQNPGKVQALRDLARPGLRLVTTVSAAPIGRYTQRLLEKLSTPRGYGTDFARRVNANVVSREANVRSVLAKVELGEADAGVVYETDARASKRVKTLPIPRDANLFAEYPVAVVAASRSRPMADAFIRFIRSEAGKSVLRQYGFR
jgi:molybdate transport system substrate-binding protein